LEVDSTAIGVFVSRPGAAVSLLIATFCERPTLIAKSDVASRLQTEFSD
jgi:hypothetical protein